MQLNEPTGVNVFKVWVAEESLKEMLEIFEKAVAF